MIHLWAQQAIDEEKQRQDENPLSKLGSPEAYKPPMRSKQAVAAKRNHDEPPVKDQLSEVALPTDLVESAATPSKSKFATNLFKHLPGTCDSRVVRKQLSDPVAECCRRIRLLDVKIRKKEHGIDKTKQELDRLDQEMTLCGEGPPNLDGDTLEDLSMQLQLSVLGQMRELADLSEARRTYQLHLYKLSYDAEAFPNIPDAMPPEFISSKKLPDRAESKPREVVLAKEQMAGMAMRDLSISPSRTW